MKYRKKEIKQKINDSLSFQECSNLDIDRYGQEWPAGQDTASF
jgi:hypothetical protein